MILDPFFGRIAFVPDLGMDLIRQFHYDPEALYEPVGMACMAYISPIFTYFGLFLPYRSCRP